MKFFNSNKFNSIVSNRIPFIVKQNTRFITIPQKRMLSSAPTKINNEFIPNNTSATPFQLYYKKVAITTSKLLSTTALSSASTVGVGALLASHNMIPSMMVCGAVWFGSFLGSLYHGYYIGHPNKTEKQSLYHAYCMQGFMGVVIAPSLMIFHQFIPHALITTTALVAGSVTSAFMMPKGSMLVFGPALYTSLWGLVGVSLTSVCSHLLGFHSFGMAMHNIDLYAGVLLFAIYNIYDTHVLISDFERGVQNYIQHSVDYSLNFINIFIRLLEIFAKASQIKKD